MNNKDRIIKFLRESGLAWCDDCLSDKTEITPRQQIYQIGSKLKKSGLIVRARGQCASCGKIKIVSSLSSDISNVKKDISETIKTESKKCTNLGNRPWYWEGNIQDVLAIYLVKEGYKIMTIANTASHDRGKDIEAIAPDGKEVWISVKGWPERSQNIQARHWFSQALFDIILYRDESKDVELALAFPEGFTTYHNLAKRVKWFQQLAKSKIFWISEEGAIHVEQYIMEKRMHKLKYLRQFFELFQHFVTRPKSNNRGKE